MPYGTIKIDTVTFTDAGVDKSVTLSGLVQNPTFSGNVTVTGTLSGVTVTGTTANFTSGNFTNISGGTHTITSGVFAAGSAASPSITFTGDLNTGIYSPGADQLAISTGGSGRLFVDASGNVSIGTTSTAGFGRGISVNGTTYSYYDLYADGAIYGRVRAYLNEMALLAQGVSSYLTLGTNNTERLRITSAGLVGVGTSSPNCLLEVKGGSAITTLANSYTNCGVLHQYSSTSLLAIGNDGTSPVLQGVNATNNTARNILLNPLGGSVGIGTTSPTQLLHVGGVATPTVSATPTAIRLDNTYTGSPATSQKLKFYLYNDGSEAYGITVGDQADFQYWSGGASTGIHRWFTSNTERARIDSSGRLGVGTSAPVVTLDVGGSTATSNGGLSNIQFYAGFTPTGGGNSFGGILAGSGLNGNTPFIAASRSGAGTGLPLTFFTDGAERIRISATGNVGIGTTSPSYALDVVSADTTAGIGYALRLRQNATAAAAAIQFTDAGATTQYGYIASDSSGNLKFATGLSEHARIDSSGRLGVGTSSPQGKLHVKDGYLGVEYNSGGLYPAYATYFGAFGTNFSSGGSEFDIWNTVGGGFAFRKQTAASTQSCLMYISSAGNVGVGTTSPGAALNIGADGDFWLASSVNNVEEKNLISWRIEDGSEGARISAFREAVSNAPHSIAFFTRTSGGLINEKVRIDSSGRLLVGTSSSITTAIQPYLQVQGTGENAYMNVGRWSNDVSPPGFLFGKSRGSAVGTRGALANNDALGEISFFGDNGTSFNNAASITAVVDGAVSGGGANDMPGRLVFSTTADGASSPTERMRITNGGDVLIGQQTNPATSRVVIQVQTGTANGVNAQITSNTGTSYPWSNYNASGTYVGGITCTSTATSFPTSSDYRLKTNIQPLAGAISLVSQLKPSTFEFNENPGETVQGFIAHELQEVVPLAVIGEKDAEDANGNPVYQGVDAAKLVPLLTAALQESIDEIESLKARVAALESA